jgi:hypothetical protein
MATTDTVNKIEITEKSSKLSITTSVYTIAGNIRIPETMLAITSMKNNTRKTVGL